MKFAKEIEQELVPEWRAKYLNYKLGKKKLKAIARALRNVQQSPRTPSRRRLPAFTPSPHASVPSYSFLNRLDARRTESSAATLQVPQNAMRNVDLGREGVQDGIQRSSPQAIRTRGTPQEALIKKTPDGEDAPGLTRYGSILGSPPSRSSGGHLPTLELPDPAVDPDHTTIASRRGEREPSASPSPPPPKHDRNAHHNAFEIGKTRSPAGKPALPSKYASYFSPKRVHSMPSTTAGTDGSSVNGARPSLRKMLSLGPDGTGPSAGKGNSDVPLEAYRELDVRQAEFFDFLDQELDKIETFYKEKEDEATKRLEVLREQLHIMRDRRLDEIISKLQKSKTARRTSSSGLFDSEGLDDKAANGHRLSQTWLKSFEVAKKLPEVVKGKPKPMSKNAKAMRDLGTPSGPVAQDNRDYVRRPEPAGVPYRTAKRKLKAALQEYYRALELLKSYALLNRTAFRKINKKYDKTVTARPTMRYMNEKVNNAWFVKSDVVDGHIHAAEDLYARYFYRGNHKVAVGKLRVKSAKAGDFNGSTFRNGLMLATGTVFGCEALSYASRFIFDDDSPLHTATSFLLQIYAGYFLMLLLVLFFCLACKVWSDQKINYCFVFEFDTRTQLDWRQLCEIPSLCVLLEGLTMWLNFSRYGGDSMYIYWPVVLVGLTLIVLFLPAPILYHRSRRWFAYSNWRLFFAGLYPVEFRDFFLGDMFCSQTYAMGNIELFFCLYANGWGNPTSCNSSHSRLLGFFTTLPGIWRALQCIRRYYDTRNVFPHLVNCGKYMWTILYYMSLSLYRLDKNWSLRSFFIFCATINATYCSVWDLVMDWSLINPYAKRPFLRDHLGYKNVYWYYTAIFLDPILRFNWIFYAIYADDVQHSAILSFVVALSEIVRRGIWTLFRVENEHCTNVGNYRASRDVPLPYSTTSTSTESLSQSDTSAEQRPSSPAAHTAGPPGQTSGLDLESQRTRESLRRRASGPPMTPATRALTRVGTMLHTAHAQDFERRKKPETGPSGGRDEDDEDEDDDDGSASDDEQKRRDEFNEEDMEDIARAEGLISRASVESPRETGRRL